MHAYRTHTCGELRKEHVGQTRPAVRLGQSPARPWRAAVHRPARPLRHHPVRDRAGCGRPSPTVDKARSEWVLTLTGKVVARTDDTVNPDLPTGEVELRIDEA